MRKLVIALGGNALLPKGERFSYSVMVRHAERTAEALRDVLTSKNKVAITHGNGPQVGALMLQNEACGEVVDPLPLHILSGETQAMIGSILELALSKISLATPVTVLTHVVVDRSDPAFRNPTKFVGPFYTEEEAKILAEKKGWVVKRDPRGGWRRVVPSPRPIDIVEKEAIKTLFDKGYVVIACGGGGIPVVREDGNLRSVDAVVDKDLASALLARLLGADELVILTDVEYVMLDFGKPTQRPIIRMSADEAEMLLRDGQFPPGTMGPKIEAAIEFLRGGGEVVRIGNLSRASDVLAGISGTVISRG